MMAFLLTDSLGGIEHYMARDSKCVLHVCVFVCVCVCTRERERERETKVGNESGLSPCSDKDNSHFRSLYPKKL
jgi:hypothetical protein